MSIVPLTVIVSLTLAFTFVVFFLGEHARGRLGGAERDSLLPLAEETPRRADGFPAGAPGPGGHDAASGPR